MDAVVISWAFWAFLETIKNQWDNVWVQSGHCLDTIGALFGHVGHRVGTEWAQSGHRVGTEWAPSGHRVGTEWAQSGHVSSEIMKWLRGKCDTTDSDFSTGCNCPSLMGYFPRPHSERSAMAISQRSPQSGSLKARAFAELKVQLRWHCYV